MPSHVREVFVPSKTSRRDPGVRLGARRPVSVLDRFWTTRSMDEFTRLQSRIAEVIEHPQHPDTTVVRVSPQHGRAANDQSNSDARVWEAVEALESHANDV